MSQYEDSIKCKYCGHFECGVNRCHLYYDYDSSIDDEGGREYLKETSPNDRCSNFQLPGFFYLAELIGQKRDDGTYIVDLKNDPQLKQQLQEEESRSSSDGCYVATCVYGSYDCPQVWTLRRFRDNILASTWYGRVFIRIYYATSPTLVRWFGNTDWFKKMWRGKLDILVKKLRAEGVEDTPYVDVQ